MEWVWNWGGECFGYIDGDDLWTYSGKHVGKISGTEIYGASGEYLGEVMNENRLIRNIAKSSWRGYSFAPYGRRGGYARYASYAAYAMYAGHEDFPAPDTF
jgi:hypothetical protein